MIIRGRNFLPAILPAVFALPAHPVASQVAVPPLAPGLTLSDLVLGDEGGLRWEGPDGPVWLDADGALAPGRQRPALLPGERSPGRGQLPDED